MVRRVLEGNAVVRIVDVANALDNSMKSLSLGAVRKESAATFKACDCY
jgi:hypothetical protein